MKKTRLKRKIEKLLSIDSAKSNYPYKSPYLTKPKNSDLSSQWCVTYSVWSYDEDKLIRKRMIVKGQSVAERISQSQEIISELSDILKTGRAYVGNKPERIAPFLEGKIAAKTTADFKTEEISINKAVKDYLDYCKKIHSKNTFKVYRTALMDLLGYLERRNRYNDKLSQFTYADAAELLKELITIVGIGNRSRNNRKGYLGTFFNYWIGLNRSKKLIKQGNPFENKHIRMLPQVSNKHQAYSEKQQNEYKIACEKMGMDYLLTFNRWLYYTLMRPHEELRHLKVRDVRSHIIYVTGESSKTNEGEYVNIPLPLEEIIQEQQIREYPGHYFVFSASGKPGPVAVGPKFFYRRHQRIINYLGLKGSGHDMYSWKHTGAIALWNATKDIELIRQQARHSTIKQTIEYLRDLGIGLAESNKIHKFPKF